MSNTDMATVSEDSRQLDHMKPSRLTDSLFSKDLAPHYMKLAGQLSASDMVPKCFRNKPADLFLCWAMGYQIGIPPEQAMNCIMVLNGKAVMWGDEMLALCMAHKDFEDITEIPISGANSNVIGYICTIKRKGRTPTVSEFTMDMAKKAGLLAKGGVWNQYPERMLKLRARGFALRDAFPDALKGIKSREEVEDYIDAEYTVSEQRGSRTELLKKDYLTKKGKIEDEAIKDNVDHIEVAQSREEVAVQEQHEGDTQSPEALAKLHLEIRELITEKGFADDRLAKAMTYYQVESIEELNWDAGMHFALRLKEL